MEILPRFFEVCKITHLTFEKDDDEYAMQRDSEICALAESFGVKVIQQPGHTLWEGHKVIKQNKGKVPLTYAQYEKATSAIGEPPRPLPRPQEIPPPGNLDFTAPLKTQPNVEAFWLRDVNYPHRYEDKKDFTYESITGPGAKFAVPTMEELAMKPATTFIRGGETRALLILEEWMNERKKEAIMFEKPKTSPAAFRTPESESAFDRESSKKFHIDSIVQTK